MRQRTALLTISLGGILLTTSGCMGLPDPVNAVGCNIGVSASSFGGPGTQLLGCALGAAAHYTLGTIEEKHRISSGRLEPTTTEPTVVRWDVTYAPLPTPGDTPAQPESPSSLVLH